MCLAIPTYLSALSSMYAPSDDLSEVTPDRANAPSTLYVDHVSVYAFIPRGIHIYLCPILAY